MDYNDAVTKKEKLGKTIKEGEVTFNVMIAPKKYADLNIYLDNYYNNLIENDLDAKSLSSNCEYIVIGIVFHGSKLLHKEL